MEKYLNKKRVALLIYGDNSGLETFLNQFKSVLFTWMFYQVGADAAIAADLTARTFAQAIGNIDQFNPNDMTLFLWLKEQAKIARDEGLLHWQLKPQRPWAWSQLPDPLLKTLSQLRSEPLRETTAANSFVQEIVQASLAEMEQNDRELMMHRYSHLDTPANIAEEMNLSVEEVNDLLYKCRHSFRRVFFQLISSVNPGFTESNTGTGIEVLDNNLEKLLRATSMYQSPSEEQETMIRERFFEAALNNARSRPPAKQYSASVIVSIAAAAVVIIGLIIYLSRGRSESPVEAPIQAAAPKTTKTETTTSKAEDVVKNKTDQTDINAEELKMIFDLGQEGNLEALLEILKSGQFTSQLSASHFIGKLGTPASIQLLEQAEDQWYPNGPANNPFAEAIAEIARRYPGQINLQEKQNKASSPVQTPTPESPKPEWTAAEGIVYDFAGKPIAGVQVEILTNPAYSGKPSKSVAKAITKEDGLYQIQQATAFDGPYFLNCKVSAEGMDIRQAVWCRKESAVTCNFGGNASLTGLVKMNDNPLNGLKLILSDTFEPDKASFSAETAVNEQGRFAFTGVRRGFYYLFSRNEAKKLVRLSTLEIQGTDVVGVDLSLQSVTVIVEYPDPNALVGGILAYQVEPSASQEEKTAKRLDNGSLLFDTVLAGTYVLKARMNNGIWLQQSVDIQPGPDEQVVSVEPLPQNLVTVKGKLIGNSPADMFLLSADQRVRVDVKTKPMEAMSLSIYPLKRIVWRRILKGN
jgi:DNA-directed RNA polymerase specialized sigma24 family protein